jgi:hypothetical protein
MDTRTTFSRSGAPAARRAPPSRASPTSHCATCNGVPGSCQTLMWDERSGPRRPCPCSRTQACAAGARCGTARCRRAGSSTPSRKARASTSSSAFSALQGLRKFSGFARGQQLQLVSDSMVTVHIVRNWTSRSSWLLAHLRKLRALCEARGITLSTRHFRPSSIYGPTVCREDGTAPRGASFQRPLS